MTTRRDILIGGAAFSVAACAYTLRETDTEKDGVSLRCIEHPALSAHDTMDFTTAPPITTEQLTLSTPFTSGHRLYDPTSRTPQRL